MDNDINNDAENAATEDQARRAEVAQMMQNELRRKMAHDRTRRQKAIMEKWREHKVNMILLFLFVAACIVLSGCSGPITTDAVIVESVIDTGGALETIEVPAVLQVCPPPPPLQRYALDAAHDGWQIDQYTAAALTEIDQRAEMEALLRDLLLVCGGTDNEY